jgi:membrane associated rhomboid family serine protease
MAQAHHEVPEDERRPPRPPRPGADVPPLWTATTSIIAANVAVYVLDQFLLRHNIGYQLRAPGLRIILPPLAFWGHFSEVFAVNELQVWRFVTFQFIHADLNHLIFNMIALYFFGPLVEEELTRRQFMPFYLLCGIGGAVMYLVLLIVGFRVGSPFVPLMGASAGIFGILVASAQIAPDEDALVFGVIPVPLHRLAYLYILYALFTVLFAGTNAGGEAAHLGGAVVGYGLMRQRNLLERIAWLGKRAPPF